jgi:hypothetical protein
VPRVLETGWGFWTGFFVYQVVSYDISYIFGSVCFLVYLRMLSKVAKEMTVIDELARCARKRA